jgi:hypothetical protein
MQALRVKWVQERSRAGRLEHKITELQSELAAKPEPPRFDAWVGASIRDAMPRQADAPPPGGVELMKVMAGGPAAKSMLQEVTESWLWMVNL